LSFIEELKRISSTRKDLIQFGRVMLAGCIILACVLGIKGSSAWAVWAGIGCVVLAILISFPKIFLPFQKIWMGFAVVAGFAISRILLMLLFYTGVSGIGLMGRLCGKSFLDLEFKGTRKSYWNRRSGKCPERASYENQF
jgi:hypothetical protein